jgi:hypothetical protein
VRWPKAAGANLCSTFHSPQFVRDHIADGWDLVEHVPCGVGVHQRQDLVVLPKPQTLSAGVAAARNFRSGSAERSPL